MNSGVKRLSSGGDREIPRSRSAVNLPSLLLNNAPKTGTTCHTVSHTPLSTQLFASGSNRRWNGTSTR